MGLTNDIYNKTTDSKNQFTNGHFLTNIIFDLVGYIPTPATVGASSVYGALDLVPGGTPAIWDSMSEFYANNPPRSINRGH